MNNLNLIFGPKLPPELESVGIAFISAPYLRADSAIGSLSAERYAKQNYDHIEYETIFSEGSPGDKLDVTYTIPKPIGISNPSASGAYSGSTTVTLADNSWSLRVLNKAIKVSGISISQANSWRPIVQPGQVWRSSYTLKASGIEPASSWLRLAIPEDGQDHNLILIYSVPEARYGSNTQAPSSLTFPASSYLRVSRETVQAITPHLISYVGDIEVLQELKINGTVKYSGNYTSNESDNLIRKLDKTLKQIDVKSAVNPDDVIEIKYLAYSSDYVYSGFRDRAGSWWPIDVNPEYGHLIGSLEDNGVIHSKEALSSQITLYALPSAAIEYKFTPNASGSATIGKLQLTFYRAINYGETHFIRHIISAEPTEDINSRDGSTVINTWGYATLGRNFYDENNSDGGDLFSTVVPSMLPLGRFILAAPPSVNSLAIADIRQRGGGLPVDFPLIAVETEENGLDKIRGYFDCGIWQGKAVKEGGVLEIEIDSSLLKTDENDTDPTKFLASEIYEMARKQICPGIDFEIKYVDF